MSCHCHSYSSFIWKFGTISFRTNEFNRKIELQLQLLDEFWKQPEYAPYGWERKYMFKGQEDIYWIKCRYYDWLVGHNFMEGGEPEDKKYKTAREKTSGLYDMGLLNENHRLTEVGRELLQMSQQNAYAEKTELGISKDSMLYLKQLLKVSYDNTGTVVRPLIVVLHLLSRLGYLTTDEFRYLMPLCTDERSTSYIVDFIEKLRKGVGTIDSTIKEFLLLRPNYQEGLERFVNNDFSEELLLSVGMNRKSGKYEKPYIALYKEMYAVYIKKDVSRIVPLLESLDNERFRAATPRTEWKKLFFDTSAKSAIKKDPAGHLLPLPDEATQSIEGFKRFFFLTMHLNKAKATLEDYQDLNRRYLGLTNCFVFEDDRVRLDVVPKQFFGAAIEELYEQAYQECELLETNCDLEAICPALTFDKQVIINGLNTEYGTHITTIEEAYDEVDKIRYERFDKLVEQKFSDEKLLMLLADFETRENDNEISQMVTDNADVPTIFEYVLGVIWWKVSGRKGKVLDYMKLSLDANLLPITHAAGGEADIVYEYRETKTYPAHSLLLEATLAENTNQRRMEMEPVSRHLGNHLLRTGNIGSYCIFITTFLHPNVISDFRGRKTTVYYDSQDYDKYIQGMKIIPLDTKDLSRILQRSLNYDTLYKHFDVAYRAENILPLDWYKQHVNIDNLKDKETPSAK